MSSVGAAAGRCGHKRLLTLAGCVVTNATQCGLGVCVATAFVGGVATNATCLPLIDHAGRIHPKLMSRQ